MADSQFSASVSDLRRAVQLLTEERQFRRLELAPKMLEAGIGAPSALVLLAPYVLGGATPLDSANAFAHMDPPTPWISETRIEWNDFRRLR